MEKSITMNGEDDDRENFQSKLYFIESFAYFLIHISFLRVNINFTKFSSSHIILSDSVSNINPSKNKKKKKLVKSLEKFDKSLYSIG